MIVVTGGAGFVGSNMIHALNHRGHDEVLVVDDLTDTRKIANLHGAHLSDYLDHEEFLDMLRAGRAPQGVEAVLHQGACSSTTEPDGRKVMRMNLGATREILAWCRTAGIPLVYASSAAVYGASTAFSEDRSNESPLNVYGWSKLLVDQQVRRELRSAGSQVVGLRYFNVYGPREAHKDEMASVVHQLDRQLEAGGPARIFGAGAGCGAGRQQRDFVHVDDVVAVALWFLEHPDVSGIFNCGTGVARTFEDLARAVIAARGGGEVLHIPFPTELEGRYQARTCADLRRLRATGCHLEFAPLEVGIGRTLNPSG